MEYQLLEMLQQRSAGAVNHALRQPRGARRVHDVGRVIERETLEAERSWIGWLGGRCRWNAPRPLDRRPRAERVQNPHPAGRCPPVLVRRRRLVAFRWRALLRRRRPLRGDKSRPESAFPHPIEIGHLLPVRRDDDVLERRDPECDLPQARQQIDLFAVVQIAIGGKENLRLDLSESIHHALRAEIRRARRPDAAECSRRQHRDDCFRDVWKPAGHSVAGPDAGGVERKGESGNRLAQHAIGDRPLVSLFVPR